MAAFLNAVSASAAGQVDIDAPSITPSGTDRFLLAIGHVGDNTPGTGATTITSDTDTMDNEFAIEVFNTYAGYIGYSITAPTASAQVCTLNRDAQYNIGIIVATFEDVDQTTPTDAWSTPDTGANIAIAVSSATDDIVVGYVSADANTITAAGDLTERAAEENFGSDGFSIGLGTAAGAATVDANWTNAAGSYGAGGIAVNINNAAAAPTANPRGPLGHPLHGPLGGPI